MGGWKLPVHPQVQAQDCRRQVQSWRWVHCFCLFVLFIFPLIWAKRHTKHIHVPIIVSPHCTLNPNLINCNVAVVLSATVFERRTRSSLMRVMFDWQFKQTNVCSTSRFFFKPAFYTDINNIFKLRRLERVWVCCYKFCCCSSSVFLLLLLFKCMFVCVCFMYLFCVCILYSIDQ